VTRLLLIEAVLLGAFLGLAFYTTGVPQPIDLQLYALIHGWDAPWFQATMAAITHLGNAPVLGPAVAVTAVALLVTRHRRAAIVVVLVGLADLVLDGAVKSILQRDRPFQGMITMRSWSFPSGHALSATAIWGILVAGWSRALDLRPATRTFLWIGWALLALTIGLSRVALGVHWPTDVIAGHTEGIMLLVLGMTAMRRWADTRTSRPAARRRA
jgi:undecaprenyl-diphosphatase